MAKSTQKKATSENTKGYEKAVIDEMEESKLRIKPWVLQATGIAFILLGLLFIIYPFAVNNDSYPSLKIPRIAEILNDIRSNDEEEDNNETIENDSEEGERGRIAEGVATKRDNASTGRSKAKSVQNSQRIEQTGVWRATDYVEGDIEKGEYIVNLGDTLWEVSEAVYGDGSQWSLILVENSKDIGFLPDGSQALITTGQVLIIP